MFNKQKQFINAESTVVAAAYDCSGAGGRKLVRMDNGWLVAGVISTDVRYIFTYVSKNNGKSWDKWTELYYASVTGGTQNIALTTYRNKIYLLNSYYNTAGLAYWGVSLPLNSTLYTTPAIPYTYITQTESAYGIGTGCSITCDKNGVLHAAWCSKNSTYPNSFNIRYSKSTNGGVTWAGATQLTSNNDAGQNNSVPCIVIKKDGNPVVVHSLVTGSGSNYYIAQLYYNGSSWTNGWVYDSTTYAQYAPCAVVDSKGVIHVVWSGMDSTDKARYNIRYSMSLNNGVTWSTPIKLTSGNTISRTHPSISTDSYGRLVVLFVNSYSTWQLERMKFEGSWGTIQSLTNSAGNQGYPQALEYCDDINSPPFIWQDNATPAIKFSANTHINANHKTLLDIPFIASHTVEKKFMEA